MPNVKRGECEAEVSAAEVCAAEVCEAGVILWIGGHAGKRGVRAHDSG